MCGWVVGVVCSSSAAGEKERKEGRLVRRTVGTELIACYLVQDMAPTVRTYPGKQGGQREEG